VRVLALRWVGIATRDYDQTLRLLRDVMGLDVAFREPTTTELGLPSGDRIQVFAPGDPYFEFFAEHARGPVILFEVDDVHAAATELRHAGVEVVGSIERDAEWEWLHARFPDGTLYELASRRAGGEP